MCVCGFTQVREDIIHNPVKMARIKHRIAEDMAKVESKKSKKDKKSHKEHKSLKHHKKESKHSRSDRRSRSRSRSVNEERSRHTRRRRSSSSRSRSAERDRESRRLKRQRSRSPEDRSRRRDRSRDDSRDRHRGDSRERERSPRRDSRRQDDDHADNTHSGDKSYGLIRKGGPTQSEGKSAGSLGPDMELLRKKEAADAEKNDWRKRLNRDGVKKLTEEEKQKRLAEMEKDALISEERRRKSKTLPSDANSEEKVVDGGPSAGFIKSMRSELYNNDLDSSAAMEDRMKRNRHYQQSSSDFDKGFLKT